MVRIDDQFRVTGLAQRSSDVREQRAVADRDQHLRELVGQRAQARAEAGRKDDRARHPRLETSRSRLNFRLRGAPVIARTTRAMPHLSVRSIAASAWAAVAGL